ncbi:MAG: hypothetical protein Q9191_002817 [Dirinaria sp. TL-2023a]
MELLGKARKGGLKPLPPKLSEDDGAEGRMDSNRSPKSLENEASTRSLAKRVRDLAGGRKSATMPAVSTSSTEGIATGLASNPQVDSSSRRQDPENSSLEACLSNMGRARPLKDRLTAMGSAASELENYSVDTVMAILDAVEDLASSDSQLEGRMACYELLQVMSCHSGLEDEERARLYNIIKTPIPPVHSKPQLLALRALLHDGRVVQPLESDILTLFVQLLNHIFNGTLEARPAFRKNRSRRGKDLIPEEEALGQLLHLLQDISTHSPELFAGHQYGQLVENLIFIANKTTEQRDLNQIAAVFSSITKSLQLPADKLQASVEVLSGIACTNDAEAGPSTWQGFCNLFNLNSHSLILQSILKILLQSTRHRQSVTVRGAVLTIRHIVEAKGEAGLPVVPFQQLLKPLQAVSSVGLRVRSDCLQILIVCLSDLTTFQRLDRLDAADWSALYDVVYEPSELSGQGGKISERCHDIRVSSPLHEFVVRRLDCSASDNKDNEDFKDFQKKQLELAYLLEPRWDYLGKMQRAFVLNLLLHAGCSSQNIALHLALDHITEDHLTLPYNENWFYHLVLLLELSTFDTTKPVTVRSRGLDLVAEAIQYSERSQGFHQQTTSLRHLVLYTMETLVNEQDVAIINIAADLGATYTWDKAGDVFEATLMFLSNAAGIEIQGSPQTLGAPASQENRATTHLVWMFLQCLQSFSENAKKLFEVLLGVARDKAVPTDARLTAMKLLTRVRCNFNFALKVVSVPDTLGLAATLYRTEASSQPYTLATNTVSSKGSIAAESPGARIGRSSGAEHTKPTRSRSTTRSGSARDRSFKAVPPLWMYPGSKGLPMDPPEEYSPGLFLHENASQLDQVEDIAVVPFGNWLEAILDVLHDGSDWEIYSYVLVHLPSQLSNVALFSKQEDFLQALHKLIMAQLRTGSFHEPPLSTGVKKGDIAVCLYHSLTVLVNYQEHFSREKLDETVRTFFYGIGMWDRAAKCCIHGLVLCAHEIPSNLRRSLLAIIQKMSQMITQSHLAVDILEFLAGLVRLPEAYQIAGPDSQDFLRTIFGICISYIHYSREQREKGKASVAVRSSHAPTRLSGLSNRSVSTSDAGKIADTQRDLPEYVSTLAYHTITFWFLAIDVRERFKHVGWIVKNLTWRDEFGRESMEDQSQVTLDMIHRTAYNDLGETRANEDFSDASGPIIKETWLYGMSIVTLETAQATGLTQITKRQASGTTHAMYQQYTAQLPPHHIEMPSTSTSGGADTTAKVFPQHVLLQLGFTIAPVPIPIQPILLPEDDTIKRAISSFDRNDTVDGHKAGVIYIAKGQSTETEILANSSGSQAYEDFLMGLGTRVCLQDAVFNTQGLDRANDTDGTHTYAWRDRVTEIVFHVTTMMPTNLDDDPKCINKKRHIGNDFVNVIYNDSGSPFNIDTFPSQFNFISIVITPEVVASGVPVLEEMGSARTSPHGAGPHDHVEMKDVMSYKVQTIGSLWFPQISPVATAMTVSAKVLPGFVRQLALNASVFSLVWSNREGRENISSWRNRLREIMKLRQRYANTGTSANVSYPGMGTAADRGGAPSYVDGDEWTGNLTMAGLAEQQNFLYSADFTRWN